MNVSHFTHIRFADGLKYVLDYKCSEEGSFQRKATDRFPLDRKVAIMDFNKNYDEAVAKLQQYLKEINSFMESDAYQAKVKEPIVPAKAEYINDPNKPLAIRLKAYNTYKGYQVQALLSDTLRPLTEYGFEISPWQLKYVFDNEKLIIDTIKLGKELTKNL